MIRSPRAGLTLVQWGLFFTAAFVAFTGARMLHAAAAVAVDDVIGMIGGAAWVIAGIMGWMVLIQRPLEIKVTVLFLMLLFIGTGWVLQLIVTGFAPLTIGLGIIYFLVLIPSFRVVYRIRNRERRMASWSESEGGAPFLLKFQEKSGSDLLSLSQQKPLLISFLRRFGSIFCQEDLKDLAQKREILEKNGVQIVLVYTVSHEEAEPYLFKWGLQDVYRVSDPENKLYAQFELTRGKFLQLYGLEALIEGFRAGILGGLGLGGKKIGDRYQMPGLFLIEKGKIKRAFRHQLSSDRPDYLYAANCPIQPPKAEDASPTT